MEFVTDFLLFLLDTDFNTTKLVELVAMHSGIAHSGNDKKALEFGKAS